jgi:hypothetical protein
MMMVLFIRDLRRDIEQDEQDEQDGQDDNQMKASSTDRSDRFSTLFSLRIQAASANRKLESIKFRDAV